MMNECAPLSTPQLVPLNRETVLKEIRKRFEKEQGQIDRVIDLLIDGWNALDLLKSIFGEEMVQRYLRAGFEVEEGGRA